ncbi:hypothetical protein ACSBR1_002918 [Camellia fascicularis]
MGFGIRWSGVRRRRLKFWCELVKERRTSELGELARSAVREGGSSYVNLDLLIEDLLKQKAGRLAKREDTN